jgi:hypothetical protein
VLGRASQSRFFSQLPVSFISADGGLTETMTMHRWCLASVIFLFGLNVRGQEANSVYRPEIPKIWDERALREMELPLIVPKYSPEPVSADYYYKIPSRTIYKSYPIYAPGRAPAGYMERLKALEPEVAFDVSQLKTKEDWVRAGEIVFEAPTIYDDVALLSQDWYSHTKTRLTREGILPYFRYVIRQKGKVELGAASCATCHLSVLEDGTVIKAGQGNFPLDRDTGFFIRRDTIANARMLLLRFYSVPWKPQHQRQLESYSLEEIAGIFESIPPGVIARSRSSPFAPPAVPDLNGVRERTYLDKSGLSRHRSIADLMRYAALAEGIELLSSFDGFIPNGEENLTRLPKAESQSRFSEEQLYALAMWLYSLEPPRNPNPPGAALTLAGKKVFDREGCGTCHTPPLYTNNKLTPATGFTVPEEHKSRYDILPVVLGTDPRLTMETRRGTGYYKVPSLRGLWYRGPFEHNGSVATLEDWFDAARLRDDYVPTGFKGYGVTTRAVKGHEFGLKLSSDDKRALVAFLKTL